MFDLLQHTVTVCQRLPWQVKHAFFELGFPFIRGNAEGLKPNRWARVAVSLTRAHFHLQTPSLPPHGCFSVVNQVNAFIPLVHSWHISSCYCVTSYRSTCFLTNIYRRQYCTTHTSCTFLSPSSIFFPFRASSPSLRLRSLKRCIHSRSHNEKWIKRLAALCHWMDCCVFFILRY